MKNLFLETQINQVIQALELFKTSCQLATRQDDEMVSKEEEKMLKKLNVATDSYLKELNKIKERK